MINTSMSVSKAMLEKGGCRAGATPYQEKNLTDFPLYKKINIKKISQHHEHFLEILFCIN